MSDCFKITVFIPTYKRLGMLKRAVGSVLNQGDFVCLHVLDNASGDGTADWLMDLASKDPRVQLTLREKNEGGFRNFVDGMESVRTPFLVPLADDDELAPGFLAAALKIMECDPSLGAVVFKTESRSDGKTTGFSPAKVELGRRDPAVHLMEWAESGHYLSWSSILWRAEPIRRHLLSGEFERFGHPGDVWIQFLVFSKFPVFLQDQVGSIFNQHGGQACMNPGSEFLRDIGEMVLAMDTHLGDTGLLEKDKKAEFLKKVCFCLSRAISYVFSVNIKKFDGAVFAQWIQDYLKFLFPFVGFNNFPFLNVFPDFADREQEIRKLREDLGRLSEMQSLISVRAGNKMAKLERHLRRMLKSQV